LDTRGICDFFKIKINKFLKNSIKKPEKLIKMILKKKTGIMKKIKKIWKNLWKRLICIEILEKIIKKNLN